MVKVTELPKRFPMELRLRPGPDGQVVWPYSWMIRGDFFYIQDALVEQAEAARKAHTGQFPSKRFVTQGHKEIRGLTVVRREA